MATDSPGVFPPLAQVGLHRRRHQTSDQHPVARSHGQGHGQRHRIQLRHAAHEPAERRRGRQHHHLRVEQLGQPGRPRHGRRGEEGARRKRRAATVRPPTERDDRHATARMPAVRAPPSQLLGGLSCSRHGGRRGARGRVRRRARRHLEVRQRLEQGARRPWAPFSMRTSRSTTAEFAALHRR